MRPVQRLAAECLALTVNILFLERVARSTGFPTLRGQGLGVTRFSVVTLTDARRPPPVLL